MVTIIFDKDSLDEGKIIVHKEVLMQSAFFRGWLADEAPVFGGTGVLFFEGHTKSAGIELANWLYSAASRGFNLRKVNITRGEAVESGLRLVEAYKLARVTELEEWANNLADACLEVVDQDLPWLQFLQQLSTICASDDGLGGLLFTALARAIRRHGWEEYMENIDKDLLRTLQENAQFATSLMKRVLESEHVSVRRCKEKSCKWHVHNITPQCGGNQGSCVRLTVQYCAAEDEKH
jgi:hypothetical protein